MRYALLIILLFLAGCVDLSCEKIIQPGEKVECYYNQVTPVALDKLDERECLKIPDIEVYAYGYFHGRDRCLSEVYRLKNRIMEVDCSLFVSNGRCHSLLYDMATEGGNISNCAFTESREDRCISFFAEKDNKISLCEKVDPDDYYCSGFRGGGNCYHTKNYCFFNIALENLNKSLCEKIDEDRYSKYNQTIEFLPRRKECLEIINSSLIASSTTTTTTTSTTTTIYVDINKLDRRSHLVCATIQDKGDRIACFLSFALNEKNSSICNNSESGMDWCYKQVAEVKEDISLCSKIKSQKIKDRCYKDVAKGNLSVCDMIHFQVTIDSCYSSVATTMKDLSICELIQDQDHKDNCYRSVAFALKNISVCDKIQKQYTKDDCYGSLAYVLKNKSICLKIQSENWRESCYSYSQIPCPRSCFKNDGADIHVKGRIVYRPGGGCPTTAAPVIFHDYCASIIVLVEYSCNEENYQVKEYVVCDYGEKCVDGACVKTG